MKILAYKGISLISRAIRIQTRSEYSHIAVELDDQTVIEAWQNGGVRRIGNYRHQHTPGTKVDVFDFEKEGFREQLSADFLQGQVGKKYDFKSVFRFVTRRRVQADDKWFCSELAEEALRRGGVFLLRGNPSEHSPRDIVLSPCLTWEANRVV